MTEEWRDVLGFEGLYVVSDCGNVQSLDRMTMGRWGKLKLSPGRSLTIEHSRRGYCRLQLCKKGKKTHVLLHRLVAEAFIPPVPGKPNVNHKDADKDNNRADNLEWCTYKENTAHARANGLFAPLSGDKHPNARFTSQEVAAIRTLYSQGVKQIEIARLYNSHHATIGAIVKGVSWKAELRADLRRGAGIGE